MWQMKELLFKLVVQALWRRRKQLYYAVSVISIAGNFIVLVGPSVQSSIVTLRSWVVQAALSALPQVTELVLHRSVLYILLNLIVVRIMVKSGVLGRTTPGAPAAKAYDFCPLSSYYVVRGLPWPASYSYSLCETQAQTMPCVPIFTDSFMWLPQPSCEDQNSARVDASMQTPTRKQQPTIKKSRNDDQPKCTPAPSLFTIEPLDELVQTTESYALKDDQPHVDKTLKHPLRKVASLWMDLHCSTQACAPPATTKDFKKAIELPKQKDEQDMQIVLAKQDGDNCDAAPDAAEHEDNRLSRQEFNERVDTFISKFKKSLTMQRQDSLNRLLGLVGGGGDIRVIK